MSVVRLFRNSINAGSVASAGFRSRLVTMLFASMTSLCVGVAASILMSVLVAYQIGDTLITTVCVLVGVTAIARVVLSCAFLMRNGRAAYGRSVASWEAAYAAGAWLFSGLLGALGALVLSRPAEISMHMTYVTFALGYTAALAARNSARPVIAYGQVLAVAPMAFVLLLEQDLFLRVLGILILLYLLGMAAVVKAMHAFLVQSQVVALEKVDGVTRVDAALNHLDRGLVILDGDRQATFWNARFAEIFGLPHLDASRTLVPASHVRTWLRKSGLIRSVDSALASFRVLSGGCGAPQPFDLTMADDRIVEVTLRPMEEGTVCLVEDVTERRREAARINELARRDVLTGLSNRLDFNEVAEVRLQKAMAVGGVATMLCLDLDGFKRVNDTYGHPMGDRLLQAVADRLTNAVGSGSLLARLGGDEFVAFADGDDGEEIAERLIDAFSYPFLINDIELNVGTSVGIAYAPKDGETTKDLLEHADLALYEAKTSGRNCWRVYHSALIERQQQQAKADIEIRDAVESASTEMICQLIVSRSNGELSALNFAARWDSKTRGVVGHRDLVRACSQIGLSAALDEQTMAKACLWANDMSRTAKVIVPLSRAGLEAPGLTMRILAILGSSQVAPSRLLLAIEEDTFNTSNEIAKRNLGELASCGIGIALDAFGSGRASLSVLERFPIAAIRLERALCQRVQSDLRSLAVIKGILAMAGALKIPVIATGINSGSQVRMLSSAEALWVEGQALLQRRPGTTALRHVDRMAS